MSADAETAVCIPNIGPRQRRLRMMGGIASFAIAIATLMLLDAHEASRWARLVLLVPFWVGAIAVLQAREKT